MCPDKLLINHITYKKSLDEEISYLKDLAKNGQKPHTMFIGCCDSRVIPEQFTNSKPGELFVLRNIGNHVPRFDENVISVSSAIIYAVKFLKVQHIVICGHTSCGGVEAASNLESIEDLSLKDWVSNLKTNVNSNVIYSMENLKTYPIIQKLLSNNEIGIHGWIYDIQNLSLKIYDGINWINSENIVNKNV
jgi:carbonic anhydrase